MSDEPPCQPYCDPEGPKCDDDAHPHCDNGHCIDPHADWIKPVGVSDDSR